jgi:hypothetical protein
MPVVRYLFPWFLTVWCVFARREFATSMQPMTFLRKGKSRIGVSSSDGTAYFCRVSRKWIGLSMKVGRVDGRATTEPAVVAIMAVLSAGHMRVRWFLSRRPQAQQVLRVGAR